MIHELLSLALLSAIATAVYLIFVTALTWAVEVKGSLNSSVVRSAKVICRTCGTDFIDNLTVEDGKCQVCGKRLCSRCGLEWICPLCYKESSRTVEMRNMVTHAQEKLALENVIRILKTDRYNKELLINQNNNVLHQKSAHLNNLGRKNNTENGSDNLNDFQGKHNNELELKTNSWEQNWLFKKKNNNQVERPLAMYLPSTNENTKALIGGINVEDLSDLSDYSDSEIDRILK